MSKDWTGDKNSIFKTLGASNHCKEDREVNDYYATDPKAIDQLFTKVTDFNKNILEPACGEGHLAKKLIEYGYSVAATDLIDRGYGNVCDFFNVRKFNGDIITNPPYKFAKEFVEHALLVTPENAKVAMFLKLTFLESKGRKEFFKGTPLSRVLVFSSRIKCAKNAEFANASNAVAYAWYVWDKSYKGEPIIDWIN